MLPRIFDLFTQVDRHAGSAQGGLGIGLTLVKSLVELHGGSVRAYSDGPGRGSEFVVRLPLAETRPGTDRYRSIARVPGGTGTAPHPGGGRQSRRRREPRHAAAPDWRRRTRRLRRPLGAGSHEGLQPFRRRCSTSACPGWTATRWRDESGANPDYEKVTLIALTGWGQEADRKSTMAAGFDYHLIKPADINALQALLASIDPATRGPRT